MTTEPEELEYDDPSDAPLPAHLRSLEEIPDEPETEPNGEPAAADEPDYKALFDEREAKIAELEKANKGLYGKFRSTESELQALAPRLSKLDQLSALLEPVLEEIEAEATEPDEPPDPAVDPRGYANYIASQSRRSVEAVGEIKKTLEEERAERKALEAQRRAEESGSKSVQAAVSKYGEDGYWGAASHVEKATRQFYRVQMGIGDDDPRMGQILGMTQELYRRQAIEAGEDPAEYLMKKAKELGYAPPEPDADPDAETEIAPPAKPKSKAPPIAVAMAKKAAIAARTRAVSSEATRSGAAKSKTIQQRMVELAGNEEGWNRLVDRLKSHYKITDDDKLLDAVEKGEITEMP